MNDWWGYSKEHGWVVLDRSIPCNQTNKRQDLLFFRFRDMEYFREKHNKWNAPGYIYFENYLLNKSENLLKEFELCFNAWSEKEKIEEQLKEKAEKRRIEEANLQAISNHRKFLCQLGMDYQGVKGVSPYKRRRITHCWSCKHELDNSVNSECAICGWIICTCGACGCGRM